MRRPALPELRRDLLCPVRPSFLMEVTGSFKVKEVPLRDAGSTHPVWVRAFDHLCPNLRRLCAQTGTDLSQVDSADEAVVRGIGLPTNILV